MPSDDLPTGVERACGRPCAGIRGPSAGRRRVFAQAVRRAWTGISMGLGVYRDGPRLPATHLPAMRAGRACRHRRLVGGRFTAHAESVRCACTGTAILSPK